MFLCFEFFGMREDDVGTAFMGEEPCLGGS